MQVFEVPTSTYWGYLQWYFFQELQNTENSITENFLQYVLISLYAKIH